MDVNELNRFVNCNGYISIWGNYFGKPGDRIITIKAIYADKSSSTIFIEFENEEIKIYDGSELKIAENGFEIMKASLITQLLNKEKKNFSSNSKTSPAFTFEYW